MPYHDVSTYHILWSDLVLIEEPALRDDGRTPDVESVTSDEGAAPVAPKAEKKAKRTAATAEASKKKVARAEKKSTAKSEKRAATKKAAKKKGK